MRWAIVPLAALAAGMALGSGNMPTTVQEVKARHESRLMAQPGVVAVGVGRDSQGADTIVVSLDRERPEVRASLPETLDGYPVRVQVIGPVRAR